MDALAPTELAGAAAARAAATSIPGYQGHMPGQTLGAFGTSSWKGVAAARSSARRQQAAGECRRAEDRYDASPATGFAYRPPSSARADGVVVAGGSVPRMANLDLVA